MAYPQVEQSGLAQEVTIFIYYKTQNGDRVPDHKTRTWRTSTGETSCYAIKLLMSSAIVAAPGSDTGKTVIHSNAITIQYYYCNAQNINAPGKCILPIPR